MVTDYRFLNTRTSRLDWPLSDITRTLESLEGATYYAQIGLAALIFKFPLRKNIDNTLRSQQTRDT